MAEKQYKPVGISHEAIIGRLVRSNIEREIKE